MDDGCRLLNLQASASYGPSPFDVDVSQRRNIERICRCRSYGIPVHALIADVVERVGRIHNERPVIEAYDQ